MENVSFVLWVILFPLSWTIERYLQFLTTGVAPEKIDTSDGSMTFVAVMYIFISFMLYRKRK